MPHQQLTSPEFLTRKFAPAESHFLGICLLQSDPPCSLYWIVSNLLGFQKKAPPKNTQRFPSFTRWWQLRHVFNFHLKNWGRWTQFDDFFQIGGNPNHQQKKVGIFHQMKFEISEFFFRPFSWCKKSKKLIFPNEEPRLYPEAVHWPHELGMTVTWVALGCMVGRGVVKGQFWWLFGLLGKKMERIFRWSMYGKN